MTTHVALLRGINVGGRNTVAMQDLRAAFRAAGFSSVRTYIQSGNVLFATDAPNGPLETEIQTMLHQHLGLALTVVLRSQHELRRVVGNAPDGFGQFPDTYHSDVVFLKSPLTSDEALGVLETRDGVDSAWAGDGVLYVQRLSARRSQSRLSNVVGKAGYQQMTIRNWATTTRLLSLLDSS